MTSLVDRLKKNSKVKETSLLSETDIFDQDFLVTDVPAINIALSGEIDGGMEPGLLTIAGLSRHFKTNYALYLAGQYLKKHADGILLFYTSEFGSPEEYFAQYGIPLDRVVIIPVMNLEIFRNDIMSQLEGLTRDDKVFIVLDSLGNLASKKEVNDALTENTAQDMTRAKVIKGLFRMITPYLAMKRIRMVVINHIYMEQKMYPKAIVSGGQGVMLASDRVWIIGRSKVKDGDALAGYSFTIKADKSRYVREGTAVPITVRFDKGLEKYSGLLPIAEAGGFVTKPKRGRYIGFDPALGKAIHTSETDLEGTVTDAFWQPILALPEFKDFVKRCFRLGVPNKVDAFQEDQEELDVTGTTVPENSPSSDGMGI